MNRINEYAITFALCALTQAVFAAGTSSVTWSGSDICTQTTTCTTGGEPPANVTCPDGSVHPPGYVCPGPPPANVVCGDGTVHPPGYVCPAAPPPVNGNVQCAGFANTIVIPMSWANPARMYTSSYGGMRHGTAVVVTFTPTSINPDNNLPRIVAAEWQSSPSTRIATLSAKPCDWGAQEAQGAYTSGTTVTIPFTVDNPNNYGYYPVLHRNQAYFFNIKNADNVSCEVTGACDIAIDLSRPPITNGEKASLASLDKALHAPLAHGPKAHKGKAHKKSTT